MTSSEPGSLEPVAFTPLSVLKELVASPLRAQLKLPLFKVLLSKKHPCEPPFLGLCRLKPSVLGKKTELEHLGLLSRSNESSSTSRNPGGADLAAHRAPSRARRPRTERSTRRAAPSTRLGDFFGAGLSRARRFQPGGCTQRIRSLGSKIPAETIGGSSFCRRNSLINPCF